MQVAVQHVFGEEAVVGRPEGEVLGAEVLGHSAAGVGQRDVDATHGPAEIALVEEALELRRHHVGVGLDTGAPADDLDDELTVG